MSRKERAETIISHKSKCFPMLAPRAQQLLAARHSRLNLSSPVWFQEQQLICSGQNRHDCCGRQETLLFKITDSMRDECVPLKIWLRSFRDLIWTRERIMNVWYIGALRYFSQSLCSLPFPHYYLSSMTVLLSRLNPTFLKKKEISI